MLLKHSHGERGRNQREDRGESIARGPFGVQSQPTPYPTNDAFYIKKHTNDRGGGDLP